RRDAQVIFNTNAITLDGRVADALIEAGLDELRVSLDASTPSTYARVRGVDAFEKVVTNLERFATLRRERGVGRPAVSLWFTALQENIEEIPGLVPLAERGGADGLHLQRLVYNGLGLARADQSLYGRLEARQRELLQRTGDAASAARIR